MFIQTSTQIPIRVLCICVCLGCWAVLTHHYNGIQDNNTSTHVWPSCDPGRPSDPGYQNLLLVVPAVTSSCDSGSLYPIPVHKENTPSHDFMQTIKHTIKICVLCTDSLWVLVAYLLQNYFFPNDYEISSCISNILPPYNIVYVCSFTFSKSLDEALRSWSPFLTHLLHSPTYILRPMWCNQAATRSLSQREKGVSKSLQITGQLKISDLSSEQRVFNNNRYLRRCKYFS